MKRKPTPISVIATAVIAAGSLGVVTTVCAQVDTGIGTNPYLRAKSAGQQPPGAPATTAKISQQDVNFIQQAAGGGAQEVQNGKMAEKQAKSAEVRGVAARIASNRARMNSELTSLAKRKGVTFDTSGVRPQNPGGADFDRAYLKLTEELYKKDIAAFERAAKSANDSDLRAWASKAIPALKQDLATVQAAEKKSASGR
jgi:putative membrane protein